MYRGRLVVQHEARVAADVGQDDDEFLRFHSEPPLQLPARRHALYWPGSIARNRQHRDFRAPEQFLEVGIEGDEVLTQLQRG